MHDVISSLFISDLIYFDTDSLIYKIYDAKDNYFNTLNRILNSLIFQTFHGITFYTVSKMQTVRASLELYMTKYQL